jgi:hypothetical protein
VRRKSLFCMKQLSSFLQALHGCAGSFYQTGDAFTLSFHSRGTHRKNLGKC